METVTSAVVGRVAEPSTWAGAAVVAQTIPVLVANPRDAQGWGMFFAGILAIFLREKK